MKKSIVFLLFVFLILSCKYKKHFYDIDGPVFEFYSFMENEILFQFNEPINNIKFILTGENKSYDLEINNIFPVANIKVPYNFFKINKPEKLNIEAEDTSGNYSILTIKPPVINNNPVLLEINEISIKYSKKNKQKIILKALTSGDISGYSLILFIRNKKTVIPFSNEEINKGDRFEILIDSSKENYRENIRLSFKNKKVELLLKYRLSQIYSLIYVLDCKDNILDYFYYYNLKKNPLEYYKDNKNFINMKNELLSFNIDPIIYDISKTTSIKTIIKKRNNFIIKK